jgi:hypothetical protein
MSAMTKVHIPLDEFGPVEVDISGPSLLCEVKDFGSVLDHLESYVSKMRSDMRPFDQNGPVDESVIPVETHRRRGG